MENQAYPIFEDPALKVALRRNLGAERAPAGLGDRVLRSLSDYDTETTPAAMILPLAAGAVNNASATATPAAFSAGSSSGPAGMAVPAWSALPGLALAAVFVVAVGSVGLFLSNAPQSLPHRFELAAVRRHQLCCGALDHHGQVIPREGYARIGAYLRQELAHPVLAANMETDGWSFKGAAICPVGDTDSAHLLFAKDNRTLSVFSLPASVLPALNDNQSYEGMLGGHCIVARRADGALYCLVGHGPEGTLTVRDLDNMLRKHEPEATVAESHGPRISVAGIVRER